MDLRKYGERRNLLWKASLNRVTAPFSFIASVLFYCVTRKENILKRGVFNEKWDTIPDSDEYYIYLNFGTFPLLYTLPHLFTHNKATFLWCQRNRTLKADSLPAHVNYLSDTPLSSISMQFVLNRLVKRLKKVTERRPNVKIHIFTGEYSYFYCIHPFIKYKIPEENYTLTISDSGVTLWSFEQLMSDKKLWFEARGQFIKIFDSIKGTYLPFVPAIAFDSFQTAMLCSSAFKNVEYQFPNVERISEPILELKSEREKIKIKNESPQKLISTLSEDDKRNLLTLFGVDKEYYDQLFSASNNPVLIITGTVAEVDEGKFHIVGEDIVKEYGETYQLFYKPHPTTRTGTITNETASFLKKYNITVLPADLPLEILLYSYPKLYIGGYKSALYLTIQGERVKFFIAKEIKESDDSSSLMLSKAALSFYAFFERLYENGAYSDAKVFWR